MPSYDLVCEKCGHKFSVFCSISQKENQKCPECDSNDISQRFTTVNIGGKSSGSSCGTSSFG